MINASLRRWFTLPWRRKWAMVEMIATLDYDFAVAAIAVTRRDNRIRTGASAPLTGAFFTPRSHGGRRWATFGLAGPCARFVTPTSSAALVVTNDRRTPLSTGVLS